MVQSCHNLSELAFPMAETRQVTAQRSYSQTLLFWDFSIVIFSLSAGPQGEERGKEGPGDEAAPKMEWAAVIYHLAKLPELNRGSPTPVNLAGIATRREETSLFLFFPFFFFFNINKFTLGKSLSSLSPSLPTNVNLKVTQKLLP